ncbi:n-type ATP pyrophosphatase superfamily protein [Pyrococcus sp. NA2]|uniref:7-cyano-7-deazaguanine synthase n=1 Tax=Pyrococcus sp. (strain NA2) TaxID=342949 RepID=UPI000209AF74|nr:7-cyano-7-deazaguanine synthase [Pyrococcus sp. NA2]AEC51758.1 n-type ATP pyrophosphatase superfamily protein [Pyrococcus sp. NA2]
MLKCSLCINDERVTRILIINGRPICKECKAFLEHPPDREKIRRELEEILKEIDRAIVAYSGGKDSTVALYLAKEKYGIDVEAVLVDHGFMDPRAIENAREVTKYLGVPLTIIKRDYSDIFREALLKAKSPCRKCSKRTMEILRKYAVENGYKYIITGHELPFGHHPYMLMSGGVLQVRILSLMSERERFEILKKLPFNLPELPGYTSNCLILGPALERFWEKHGYSFEHRRIAALVRYGLIEREKALKKVEKPNVPREQKEYVYKKLGLEHLL